LRLVVSFEITSDHAAGFWTAKKVDGGYYEERSRSIGLKKDGEFVAGVIYENWHGKSITCHIAVTGRMTPAYLFAIFDYPFNVCKVGKMIAPVSSANIASIRFVEKMGFQEEARIIDAMADGDMVIFTMPKERCKYLENRYGKKCTSSTRST
jgi:RimJ/RimL family protein N-acetyltransferase